MDIFLLSDDWIRISWYQMYTGPHGGTMSRQIHLWGFLLSTNEDGKSTIDQIISLLAHNSQNYQNHKSLKLEIVVRRVVLAFFVCFVTVVHLLINKGIISPDSSVVKAC